jgi:hypothetical protein
LIKFILITLNSFAKRLNVLEYAHLFPSLSHDQLCQTVQILCEFCYSNFDHSDLINHVDLKSLDEEKRTELNRLMHDNRLMMKRDLSLYAIGQKYPLVIESHWTSSVTSAHTQLDTINDPFATFRFVTSQKKLLKIELNPNEIDSFISTLENVHAQLTANS